MTPRCATDRPYIHEPLTTLGVASTVTPQGLILGRGYDRYPSVGKPLGAVMTVTPAWLHLRTSHT